MFYISCKKEDIKFETVKDLLKQTYWANHRNDEMIQLCIESSECFGAYLTNSNQQIAFARVVTDYMSMFYISDVIVNSEYRGIGIGKALVQAIVTDERFKNLRGILVTKDAHGLYEQFGFSKATDWYMGKEPVL